MALTLLPEVEQLLATVDPAIPAKVRARCGTCDNYGWVPNPADRFGDEIPCPECSQ